MICEICDRQLVWGGTSGTLPHTEEFHAQERRRWLYGAKLALIGKVAVLSGHTVTIRFTEVLSWTECSCGWKSYLWPDSGRASSQGHTHLFAEGMKALDSPDES